jgi:hypothetical protein
MDWERQNELGGWRARPRGGRSENSPAVYCWVKRTITPSEPVKRATENQSMPTMNHASVVHFADYRCLYRLFPSDKSLGYFQFVRFADWLLVACCLLFT